MRLRSTTFAILAPVALLGSCEDSIVTNRVRLPNLPASVTLNGEVIKIPKGPLNAQQTADLLAKIRHSESSNARAVRTAKALWARMKRRYEKDCC